MHPYKEAKASLLQKFTSPLESFLAKNTYSRKCPELDDSEWVKTGLLRVFSQERSSRGFLQQLLDMLRRNIASSSFFDTLKSERRLLFCRELNHELASSAKSKIHDPLSIYQSLGKYDIYAGDGHYRESSSHDPKINDKKYAVGHFYTLNLRTQMLTHLDSMVEEFGRKKEHDMHMLKRLTVEQLRQGAIKGKKVIYVWDCAGIDIPYWDKLKKVGGIYFISMEKENMKFEVTGNPPSDKSNPINEGVISDEWVFGSAQIMMRRVRYQCPISGKVFSFLTNLMELEPGLIAHLYKQRWNIEKVYDELKTKLSEKKAWAKGKTARNMQAEFTCLAHNLMVLFEDELSKSKNLRDEKEQLRRKTRLEQGILKASLAGRKLPSTQETLQCASQRSHKFIRWLRNHCFTQASYEQALLALARLYQLKPS